MMRYYEGKTTWGMLVISGLVGEVIPVLLIISLPPVVALNQLVFPLPLHLLAGFIIITMKPPPVITSPWVDENEAENTKLHRLVANNMVESNNFSIMMMTVRSNRTGPTI